MLNSNTDIQAPKMFASTVKSQKNVRTFKNVWPHRTTHDLHVSNCTFLTVCTLPPNVLVGIERLTGRNNSSLASRSAVRRNIACLRSCFNSITEKYL